MPSRRMVLALGAAASAFGAASAESAAPGLHPRLIATPGRLAAARAALEADGRGRAVRDSVVAQARALLTQPPATRADPAPHMLETSRLVLRRVQTLGIAHGLAGGPDLLQRGIAEVMAACAFPDWNPAHFLDTAEMAHAVALGFDWFHAAMTPVQRATVVAALIEKALRPAEAEFQRHAFWVRATHNWNIVCCGGIAIGALAVMDEAPELAGALLTRCLSTVELGFSSYGAHGGWAEGPGYWRYATEYAVALLAALETSGWPAPAALAQQPGLAGTGGYYAHMTGPGGQVFNFADGPARVARAPELLWLAAHRGQPSDAWTEQQRTDRPLALDALWHRAEAPPPAALDASFPATGVASFRSAWGRRDATWLAIKGGDNATNHAHLDLGTFVIESGGQRFGAELGWDDYALPGYFTHSGRWAYARTASRGQSVLVRNDGDNQALTGRGPLLAFMSEPGFAFAAFDLSSAYPGLAHRRAGALLDRQHVAILDETRRDATAGLTWQMLTEAQIVPMGRVARLTLGGAVLWARLQEAPDGCVFEVASAAAPPPENANAGFRRLVVRVPAGQGTARLLVVFSPDGAGLPDVARLRRPLVDWRSQ